MGIPPLVDVAELFFFSHATYLPEQKRLSKSSKLIKSDKRLSKEGAAAFSSCQTFASSRDLPDISIQQESARTGPVGYATCLR